MAGRDLSSAVRVIPGAEELAAAAAERVAAVLADGVAARGRAALVLAGGRTPRRAYELLAMAALPWERIWIYWGDERCVPPDDAASNYRMAREALLSRIAIPQANVRRIAGEAPPEEAAAAYEREVDAALAEAPFDAVLLGMGADGHVASLFPGTTAMAERERRVVATFVPRLSAHRVTLTLPALATSRTVTFLVAGADKVPALERALRGAPDVELPASCVRSRGEIAWLLDGAAGAAGSARA